MNKIRQFGAVLAVSTLFVTSTFAESRPQNEADWRRAERREERREERRDDRRYERNLSAQGRVTNLHRERDGYRVQLDRGSQWYYVPSSAWRGHNRGLSIGISVRLGGGYYDDRGYIYVSNADIYDDYRYGRGRRGDGYVSGVVQRIDYRRDVMEIRDQRSGRSVTVDARRADRRRQGIDVSDIRRGDYVELEGTWVRGNVFMADRIDALDSRR